MPPPVFHWLVSANVLVRCASGGPHSSRDNLMVRKRRCRRFHAAFVNCLRITACSDSFRASFRNSPSVSSRRRRLSGAGSSSMRSVITLTTPRNSALTAPPLFVRFLLPSPVSLTEAVLFFSFAFPSAPAKLDFFWSVRFANEDMAEAAINFGVALLPVAFLLMLLLGARFLLRLRVGGNGVCVQGFLVT